MHVEGDVARRAEIAQRSADAVVQLVRDCLTGRANHLVFDEDAAAICPLVPADARAQLLAGVVGAHLSLDHIEAVAVLVRVWGVSRQGTTLLAGGITDESGIRL